MSKFKNKLKTILMLDILALGTMHIINKSIESSALLKNFLKPHTGRYYSWKFGDIFYKKEGKGSPILLIHDLNISSSGYEWYQLIDILKKKHTLYTIDLLGCGRSEKPGITYTSYLYVQMISDFIKDVIGEKTDIISTGLSSSFVVMTAHANSGLIGDITMVNPISLNKLEQVPDKKSKIMTSIVSIPIIGTTLYNIKTCRQNIEYAITEKYFYNPFHAQQKCIDTYYESAHYHHGNGKFLMASLDGYYLNVNIRRVLPQLDNNITIIYGDKLENEREIVQSYKKLNKKISTKVVAGTKLLPHMEKPEEFASKL